MKSDAPTPQAGVRFMSWRDMVLTPLLETAILACCAAGTWLVHRFLVPLDLFAALLAAYALLITVTVAVLIVLRLAWPQKPGIYTEARHPWRVYRFNLQGFLCCCNLGPFYLNGGAHLFLKKPFYRLLGATFGRNIMMIAGSMEEPDLVHLEDNVLIGSEAVLSPHVMTIGPDLESKLILGKIRIKRGALIGARSMILPSVTVGENSIVSAMSLVSAFTVIPPNEIWGGVPAKKIGDVQRPDAAKPAGSKPADAPPPALAESQPAPTPQETMA